MKIKILADNKKINLWIPNCLLNSRIGISLLNKVFDDNDNKFILDIFLKCYKELIAYKKKHGKIKLVQVESKDGERIEIIF